MITNEEGNAKLTDDQLAAIEVAQQRLFNIQNETASANRTLSALKNDSVVALRDKQYQEEQLANIVALVGSANSKLNQLNESIAGKETELSILTQKIAVKADELTSKEEYLKSSEESLSQEREQLALREGRVGERERNVEVSERVLEAKIIRINEAING